MPIDYNVNTSEPKQLMQPSSYALCKNMFQQ